MLTTQSATEFTTARHQAFIEEWLSFFTGRSKDLLSFEEVKQNLRLQDAAYKGLQEIELDKIIGSTGRYRDFTRTFLPKNDQTKDRWRRVDAVAHDLQGFPPIEVYQVGGAYFVRDGNHRVSVARTHKAKTIEAYVIEYKTSVPIDKDDDMDSILLKWGQTRFFEKTRLDKIRPDQNLIFTEPGRYRLVREHIAFHKYFKETDCGCEISYEEAVGSWYDNVYMPIIELIRKHHILEHFPDRTEADLYAWLLLHRATLEKEINALGYVSNEDLIESLKRERATNPFARLVGLFRNRLELEHLPLRIERTKFLDETQLDKIRPEHNISFTEPGGYQLVQEHITVHKYLKEIETNSEFSYEEAESSWYDNVYMPLVQLIRERDELKHFPNNTEADLYLWLVSRRATLEEAEHTMGHIPNEKIIEMLEQESMSDPIAHLANFFNKKLNLQHILAD